MQSAKLLTPRKEFTSSWSLPLVNNLYCPETSGSTTHQCIETQFLIRNPVLCLPSLYLCSSNLILSNNPDFHQWLRTSKCIYPALLSPSNSGSLLDSPVQMLNGYSKPTWTKLLSIPQYSSPGLPIPPQPLTLGLLFPLSVFGLWDYHPHYA